MFKKATCCLFFLTFFSACQQNDSISLNEPIKWQQKLQKWVEKFYSREQALPASWEIYLTPKTCYKQTEKLPLSYTVWDSSGNVIEQANIKAQILPSGNILELNQRNLLIAQEGKYRIRIWIDGELAENHTIIPQEFDVTVDSTPPNILVSAPERAAFITSASDTVPMHARVIDTTSTLKEVSLNHATLPIQSSQQYTIAQAIPAQWGTNDIIIKAIDACGNQQMHVQSFIQSSNYSSAAITPMDKPIIHDAFVVRLPQHIVDDGDRSDTDDLATLSEKVLAQTDWNDIIPSNVVLTTREVTKKCNGFWSKPEYSFSIVRDGRVPLQLGAPSIRSIQLLEKAVAFDAWVPNLSLKMQIEDLKSHTCQFWMHTTLPLGGHGVDIYADGLRIAGTIPFNITNRQAALNFDDISIDINSFNIDLDCPSWIDWGCDAIVDIVMFFAEDAIVDSLSNTLRSELGSKAQEALASLAPDIRFMLPPPINLPIHIRGGVENASFSSYENGTMHASFWAQIYPEQIGKDIPLGYGSLLKNSTSVSLNPSLRGNDFSVQANIDMVNQALWSIWYAGGMTLDNIVPWIEQMTQKPLSGIALSTFAKLPPVVSLRKEDALVSVQVGDCYADTSINLDSIINGSNKMADPIAMDIWSSGKISGALAYSPENRQLFWQKGPLVDWQLMVNRSNRPADQGKASMFLGKIMQTTFQTVLKTACSKLPPLELKMGEWTHTDIPTWNIHALQLTPAAEGQYYELIGSFAH